MYTQIGWLNLYPWHIKRSKTRDSTLFSVELSLVFTWTTKIYWGCLFVRDKNDNWPFRGSRCVVLRFAKSRELLDCLSALPTWSHRLFRSPRFGVKTLLSVREGCEEIFACDLFCKQQFYLLYFVEMPWAKEKVKSCVQDLFIRFYVQKILFRHARTHLSLIHI